MITPEDVDRFWLKINIFGDCWVWIGSVAPNGYGHFWDGCTMAAAHRVSYEHFIGPIPKGLQLDHLCRNRACVNPDHLEPVTPSENALRGNSGKWRQQVRPTVCKQGHPFSHVDKRGIRRCRICNAARQRASVRRRKEAKVVIP